MNELLIEYWYWVIAIGTGVGIYNMRESVGAYEKLPALIVSIFTGVFWPIYLSSKIIQKV